MITFEPAPGQSPIPVVIVEQDHGMTTGEIWVTGSTIALTLVTMATLVAMIHQDHKLVQAVIAALKALTPPYRAGLRPGKEPAGTDVTNAPAAPVNKIISDRSA